MGPPFWATARLSGAGTPAANRRTGLLACLPWLGYARAPPRSDDRTFSPLSIYRTEIPKQCCPPVIVSRCKIMRGAQRVRLPKFNKLHDTRVLSGDRWTGSGVETSTPRRRGSQASSPDSRGRVLGRAYKTLSSPWAGVPLPARSRRDGRYSSGRAAAHQGTWN